MSLSTTIPLETWLGHYTMIPMSKGSEETVRAFKQSQCVKTHMVGMLPDNHLIKPTIFNRFIGGEFVIGINNLINTDVMCWPEGIKEDFSNLHISFDKEKQKFVYQLILNINDVEDKEFFQLVDEENGDELIETENVIFVIEPKFICNLDNQSTMFMDLLTSNGQASTELANGLAMVARIAEGAPEFTILNVDLETYPTYIFLTEEHEFPETIVIGICRYLNKVTNGIIHEDMVEKIKHIRIMETEDNKEKAVISIDLFGKLYMISATIDFSYTTQEEQVAEVEFDETN